jgi:hypothetical protein
METIVIAALGGLLVNALSGIVGNRADAAVTTAWKTIVERIKKGGKHVNHDLERAVMRSFTLALKSICDDCINELRTKKKEHTGDIGWLEQKRRSLDEELKMIEKADYVEPSVESLKEIELLLLPDGTLAQDAIHTVKAKLIDAATGYGEPPLCYKEKVEKDLFERMSAYFATEIKNNQVVRNILEGQLLAQIDVRLQGQQLTVERIEASLRHMAQAVPEVIEKLTAILGADNQQMALQKSLALRLGYVVAAIKCYLDAQNIGLITTALTTALEIQSKRAYGIAKALGLSVSPDPNVLVNELPVQLESRLYAVKIAFRIGNIIGRVYFYAIGLMATGSLPPIDQDIERIRAAEQLLREAELPADFLEPVRRLWQDTLKAAHRGATVSIDERMEDVIDQLCKSIEAGIRYHA